MGVTLKPTLTCSTIAMLKRFAMDGGVALLPEFVIEEQLRAGTLIALPLQHAVFSNTEAQLITRLGRQLSVAATRLMTLLLQEMTAFRA